MPFTPVTITHDFDLPDQAGALGIVEFTPVEELRNGGQSIAATPIRKALTADGALSQTIPATTDPGTGPPGVPYRIVVRITGQPPRTYYAPVPHDRGSTIDLAALLAWATAGLGGGAGSVSGDTVTLVAEDGVITPDAALGDVFVYDADADVELTDPLHGANGRPIVVIVRAATTTRTLSFDGGLVDPVTVTPGAPWIGTLRYLEDDDTWVLTDGSGGGDGVASARPPEILSASSGVITPNAALSNTFRHVAPADVELAEPINGSDDQDIGVFVKASGANRVLSFDAIGATPITITAGTWRSVFLRYIEDDDAWLLRY